MPKRALSSGDTAARWTPRGRRCTGRDHERAGRDRQRGALPDRRVSP